jgi:hypothetical protein
MSAVSKVLNYFDVTPECYVHMVSLLGYEKPKNITWKSYLLLRMALKELSKLGLACKLKGRCNEKRYIKEYERIRPILGLDDIEFYNKKDYKTIESVIAFGNGFLEVDGLEEPEYEAIPEVSKIVIREVEYDRNAEIEKMKRCIRESCKLDELIEDEDLKQRIVNSRVATGSDYTVLDLEEEYKKAIRAGEETKVNFENLSLTKERGLYCSHFERTFGAKGIRITDHVNCNSTKGKMCMATDQFKLAKFCTEDKLSVRQEEGMLNSQQIAADEAKRRNKIKKREAEDRFYKKITDQVLDSKNKDIKLYKTKERKKINDVKHSLLEHRKMLLDTMLETRLTLVGKELSKIKYFKSKDFLYKCRESLATWANEVIQNNHHCQFLHWDTTNLRFVGQGRRKHWMYEDYTDTDRMAQDLNNSNVEYQCKQIAKETYDKGWKPTPVVENADLMKFLNTKTRTLVKSSRMKSRSIRAMTARLGLVTPDDFIRMLLDMEVQGYTQKHEVPYLTRAVRHKMMR